MGVQGLLSLHHGKQTSAIVFHFIGIGQTESCILRQPILSPGDSLVTRSCGEAMSTNLRLGFDFTQLFNARRTSKGFRDIRAVTNAILDIGFL